MNTQQGVTLPNGYLWTPMW